MLSQTLASEMVSVNFDMITESLACSWATIISMHRELGFGPRTKFGLDFVSVC